MMNLVPQSRTIALVSGEMPGSTNPANDPPRSRYSAQSFIGYNPALHSGGTKITAQRCHVLVFSDGSKARAVGVVSADAVSVASQRLVVDFVENDPVDGVSGEPERLQRFGDAGA